MLMRSLFSPLLIRYAMPFDFSFRRCCFIFFSLPPCRFFASVAVDVDAMIFLRCRQMICRAIFSAGVLMLMLLPMLFRFMMLDFRCRCSLIMLLRLLSPATVERTQRCAAVRVATYVFDDAAT